MAAKRDYCSTLLQILSYFLLSSLSYGTESDIFCLKTVKNSISDPNNFLASSWQFNNTGEGSICEFYGIDCWVPNENKVLNIRLSNIGLTGNFPLGLENCTSLTGLNLSNNNFSGPIPANISTRIPFATSLDLSFNNFSGIIPVSLSNCTYLNVLNLQHNRLTGQIPVELAHLDRLIQFNVTDNMLSGPIPTFHTSFSANDYANNPGLCGEPLSPCTGASKKSPIVVVVGSAIGVAVLTVLIVGVIVVVIVFFFPRRVPRRVPIKKKEKDVEENKCVVLIALSLVIWAI